MTKERELLKRTLKFIVPKDDESLDYDLLLYSQIRDLLAEPEPEPDIDYIVSEKGIMRTTLWTQIHEALINDFNNYGIEISPIDNKVIAGKSMTKVINDVVDLICQLQSSNREPEQLADLFEILRDANDDNNITHALAQELLLRAYHAGRVNSTESEPSA